ncbi:hypothetical protein KUTeg_000423 [Tegillarca granosa]|uniref:Uncharacterized protein n=1 Tax=Tegillarca granosa TaxID=220873 RepID=A0ABQ9FXG7_TEGGR|nr:hypothetical protein KUTeg_000423 [Tegillarca granosa]
MRTFMTFSTIVELGNINRFDISSNIDIVHNCIFVYNSQHYFCLSPLERALFKGVLCILSFSLLQFCWLERENGKEYPKTQVYCINLKKGKKGKSGRKTDNIKRKTIFINVIEIVLGKLTFVLINIDVDDMEIVGFEIKCISSWYSYNIITRLIWEYSGLKLNVSVHGIHITL